jgi:hypothetical protein
MSIGGHLKGFDGGFSISLCYLIEGVENPTEAGESNNFDVSIYDVANK